MYMENEYIIEMLNITKEFPGIKANDNITLQLKKGEIHALLGENGAGKSTLMSILFGLYQPTSGIIKKNGQEVHINTPNDANDLNIGMVHQHFKLVECFSVLDNIILGVEPTKGLFLEKKNARAKVMELSEKYGLMVDPDALISDITVGMQQRTEILKMLYRDNEILIFDEPTAVLTPQEIDELMKIMKNLAKEGKSILFITHKLNEIMEVADRCTILRKGKYIGTVNISETSKEELSRMMVGRNVSFSVNKKPSKPGDTVLKVEHMTVPSKVHGNNAVKDVSFNVRKGEIVCIAGIDGNGQSEFVQGLTGLEKVSGGKILFNGQDICRMNKKQLHDLRKDLQIIFQDPYSSLNPRFTIGQIIEEGLVTHKFFRHGSPKMREHVVRTMKECGLQEYMLFRYPHQFSGGQRQRISIARALAVHPKFVVCDECVSALDVSIQSQIINLLQELKQKEHLTYMFISHDLSVVRYISDRICVMYLGNVVELADAATVFGDPRHPYTVALLSSIPTTDMESLKKERILLEGSIPSPVKPPDGCKFHTRCWMACDKCRRVPPPLAEIEPGHFVACHFPERKLDENGNYLFEMPKTEKKSAKE